jgi:serine/threonine protein kinase/Cdc6-like AAA superfamily ATPase
MRDAQYDDDSRKPAKLAVLEMLSEYIERVRIRVETNLDQTRRIHRLPFHRNRDKYQVTIPLKPIFRFAHEPVRPGESLTFIGREAELDDLVQRILFSDGGAFLITGYRGVGKTSFINQVIGRLNQAAPWASKFLGQIQVLDILLNIARPLQPAELMHHIIRRLYQGLIEQNILPSLPPALRDELLLAYYRTSVNMTRKLAESSEKSFGFNEASLGTEHMKATLKSSLLYKRSATRNYEVSFLGYDDKAAENDIIRISHSLAAGYIKKRTLLEELRDFIENKPPKRVRLKIVFVFDELDKLEEFGQAPGDARGPVIDELLGSLKNLFTTSGISFIFIAGKDLQERWLDDIGRGDSVYESVFSYDKYLPCMWADVDGMCDLLVERDELLLYSYQAFTDFKKYLSFKGRGIPRRINKGFNEYVKWNEGSPRLSFTRQDLRRIRFYANLQDVISEHDDLLFGDIHEEVAGTQQDKKRLGLYYLVDWVLRQGSAEFTLADAINASKHLSSKIAPAEEVAPRVITDILNVLLSKEYLQEVRAGVDRTHVMNLNAPAENRYKLTQRRLAEMEGLAGAFDEEALALKRDEMREHRISGYGIIDLIGRGGMSRVYRAVDEKNGRLVALKVQQIYSVPGSYELELFEREAEILKSLDHPNIVKFYEAGERNGQRFIAMDYIDGIDLSTLLKSFRQVSVGVAISVITRVANALSYVHGKRFARLDLKPSNIMLSKAGGVYLIDFGTAKSISTTSAGTFIGTPMYMSPEAYEGRGLDVRSDIYSLGVVLYEMITGSRPFKGLSVTELMREKSSTIRLNLPEHSDIPPQLKGIIFRCLRKSPEDRFQDVDDLITELKAVSTSIPGVDLASVVESALLRHRHFEERENQVTAPGSVPFYADAQTPLRPADSSDVSRSMAGPEADSRPGLESWDEGADAILELESPHTLTPAAHSIGAVEGASQAHLLIISSPHNREVGTVIDLGKEVVKLGRSSENDFVLDDEKISRFHIQINNLDGEFFIEDLNSFNGSFVNDNIISGLVKLNDGDKITVGNYVFEFTADLLEIY